MRLVDVIARLDSVNRDLCIVAKQPWTRESDADLLDLTEEGRVPPEAMAEGYEYFLEVDVALDDALPGSSINLSPEQRFDAVLYYAVHDASPPWLNELSAISPRRLGPTR
jgi:hypothetical protein